MAEKGLFSQNVIAVIWDFDKTLSPDYMQGPLFREYGIDEEAFWREVDGLPAYYARAGVHVQRDTCYLGHILTYVKEGKMPGLTNKKLRELGGGIRFFPGIPVLFDALRATLNAPPFQAIDLHIEYYVVSTGIAEMVRGSSLAPQLDGIWASEFIETPAQPGFDPGTRPEPGPITQIAALLDHTTKTRALFEINKGINKLGRISVNDAIPEDARRVPFKNMVYIADGPSDIPSFSVVRKGGGLAYAVFDPASPTQFAQAVALQEQQRVDAYGPADYRPESQTAMWLQLQVSKIAHRMVEERTQHFDRQIARGPRHLDQQKGEGW